MVRLTSYLKCLDVHKTQGFLAELGRAFVNPKKNVYGYIASLIMHHNYGLNRRAVKRLNIESHEKILEIGIGLGQGVSMAAKYVADGSGLIYGVDHSKFMLSLATTRCREEAKDGHVKLMYGSVQKLPLPEGTVSGIFHVDNFYLWEGLPMACREMYRVLRQPGRMVGVARRSAQNCAACDEFVLALKAAGFATADVEISWSVFGRIQAVVATKQ